jgi:hypothetical protein
VGRHERLELVIAVTPTPAPLELQTRVDPLQLQGLTFRGGAKGPVSGVVLDARSQAPIPWATLTLTRDAARDRARTPGDDQGIVRTSDVETAAYLLRMERLGYVSQYRQPCGSTNASANCIVMFGRTYAPRVVIDELG